ncbi:MAG: rubredoxin [Magnetococcales bacterium]|nr:rubredoxin [Magnetococcales bacterium]
MPYICDVCDWVYDESTGDPDGDIAPGTAWEDIPDDWECPVCGVAKDEFTQVEPKKQVSEGDYLAKWRRDSDTVEPQMKAIFSKALTGAEEISPMRTTLWRNLLEDIVFLPAQLAHVPLDKSECHPEMSVVIGPKAEKPLKLSLPFYVSDMSFGSMSRESKVALAKGSAAVGTAIFGGEGGLLEEEFDAARSYVFEYSTGHFGATDENLRKAHAIQIKAGQAAKAGLGGHLLAAKVTDEIARVRGVESGKDVISPARHMDIQTPQDLKDKVDQLRQMSAGRPVGIKIVASHIEQDLEVALFAGVDFITIDCRGGATGAAPVHIKDNVCIPAPYALARARKFLDASDPEKSVSLLITGGMRTSADIAKCLAMGADAVGLSTTAMIGIGCQQYRVCHKGSCPVGIATQDPDLRSRLDVEQSAKMLENLFTAYRYEIEEFIRICGKRSVSALSSEDLCSLSRSLAIGTGLSFAGISRDSGSPPARG